MGRVQEQPKAILELWEIFLRYRARFILPCFIVSVVVLGVAFALPRKYRAAASFERRTDVVLAEMANRGAARVFTDPRHSVADAISGRRAVNEALAGLAPELRATGHVTSDADLQRLADHVMRHVIVAWEVATPELDRARVEYLSPTPEVALLVVDALVSRYIERTRESMDVRLRESAEFFGDEVARHRATIESLENSILEFEIRHGELLPDRRNNFQDRIASLQALLADAERQRDAAALRAQTLRQALAETPELLPTVIRSRNPEVDSLHNRRRDLHAALRQALVEHKMTEAHPDVINTRYQIAAIEDALQRTDAEIITQRQMTANPKRAELELQLSDATSQHRVTSDQIASLREQLAQATAATASMFDVRSAHRKLNRELGEAQRQLGFWEDNLRRVQMALTAEAGNRGVQLSMVQEANVGVIPVSPKLAQVFTAAGLLGALAGGLAVFIAYRRDDTFADGDAVAEATGLPLIGVVGELVVQQRQRLARRIRQAVVYPVQGVAMATAILTLGSALYLHINDPDELNALRTQAMELVRSVAAPATATAASPPADAAQLEAVMALPLDDAEFTE